MNELIDKTIECPYCGESIDVLIDQSEAQQSYVEDCHVCCRPIVFKVTVDPDGDANITVRSENE